MSSINRLKREKNYKYVGTDSKICLHCTHYQHEEPYAGVDGMSAHSCMYYRDTNQGSPVILSKTGGGCDEFK